jgi:hypothetical protein
MYILIQHFLDNDTMVVICHWHYMPSQEEIKDMIADVEPCCGVDQHFFVVEGPDVTLVKGAAR